ncbi:hypothetical protein FEM48_Zijuj07G0060000 [Ziziphus jujuba var. spinosa]|uniref:Uncharacterized protein n=1 Tax=Ziziphus jujuba var. spinosa TaxID=714518 RepID=A0A978V2W1_ZIZJJ|nr:hypothetical protein FEM48_Zijuj07G0060000 [Ziziphus jujuba var. spinosa]
MLIELESRNENATVEKNQEMENGKDDMSFDNASNLEKSIKEKCAFKMDIGPLYSVYMILVLITFCVSISEDMEFIAGFVMAKQEELDRTSIGESIREILKVPTIQSLSTQTIP